jgi:hypothetical protein
MVASAAAHLLPHSLPLHHHHRANQVLVQGLPLDVSSTYAAQQKRVMCLSLVLSRKASLETAMVVTFQQAGH